MEELEFLHACLKHQVVAEDDLAFIEPGTAGADLATRILETKEKAFCISDARMNPPYVPNQHAVSAILEILCHAHADGFIPGKVTVMETVLSRLECDDEQ